MGLKYLPPRCVEYGQRYTQYIPWTSYQIRKKCGLCMRRECWERFPRRRLQRKPLVSDRGLHARAVMHVGIANPRWRGNVPGIPRACTTRNFPYLVRGPCAYGVARFVMLSASCRFLCIIASFILFMATSLARCQSHDCTGTSKLTLRDMYDSVE